MVQQVLSTSIEANSSVNLTGYDFDSIDWYNASEAMAQSPNDAILLVCRSNYIPSQRLLNFSGM